MRFLKISFQKPVTVSLFWTTLIQLTCLRATSVKSSSSPSSCVAVAVSTCGDDLSRALNVLMELNWLAVGLTQERFSVERDTFGLVWICTWDVRPGVDLHVRHSVWCGSTREAFGLVWIYTWDIRSGVDPHVRHATWCLLDFFADLINVWETVSKTCCWLAIDSDVAFLNCACKTSSVQFISVNNQIKICNRRTYIIC